MLQKPDDGSRKRLKLTVTLERVSPSAAGPTMSYDFLVVGANDDEVIAGGTDRRKIEGLRGSRVTVNGEQFTVRNLEAYKLA